MRRLRVRKAGVLLPQAEAAVGDLGLGETDRRLDDRQIDLLPALQPVVKPRQRQTRRLGRRGRTRDRQPVAAGDERNAELALDPVEMLVALAVQHRQQQIVVEFELGLRLLRAQAMTVSEPSAVMRRPSPTGCFDRRPRSTPGRCRRLARDRRSGERSADRGCGRRAGPRAAQVFRATPAARDRRRPG